MNLIDRLQAQINVNGVPIWKDGHVIKYLGEHTVSGNELAYWLTCALEHRKSLDEAIAAMAHLLETPE
jgi:hypothetical protein